MAAPNKRLVEDLKGSTKLAIEDQRNCLANNMGRNEMLCHRDVFEQLRRWL